MNIWQYQISKSREREKKKMFVFFFKQEKNEDQADYNMGGQVFWHKPVIIFVFILKLSEITSHLLQVIVSLHRL